MLHRKAYKIMIEKEKFNKIMDELLFNTVQIYQHDCSNLTPINIFEPKHKDLSLKCDINFIFGGIIDYSALPNTDKEITQKNIEKLKITQGVMLYCTSFDTVIGVCDFKNETILVNKNFILKIIKMFTADERFSNLTTFEISKMLIPYLKYNMNFKNKQLLNNCYNKFLNNN